jgi:hypothetical protein
MIQNDSMIGTGPRGDRLRGLILVNAVLLAVLAAVTFGAKAFAQYRPRGEYTMVAGGVNGADSNAVYIVDTTNQEMIAVTYDPNTKTMLGIGYKNVAADAASVMRSRPGN